MSGLQKWLSERLRSPLTEEGYESCINCGWCCKKSRCGLGAQLHGPGRDCPSLVFKEGRYWCREVMEAEGAEKERLIDGLSIGGGCCANLNTDRQTMLEKTRKKE